MSAIKKARFRAAFTVRKGSSTRVTRTFKGTIEVSHNGDLVAASIGALHGIYKEEELGEVAEIDLRVSAILPRKRLSSSAPNPQSAPRNPQSS